MADTARHASTLQPSPAAPHCLFSCFFFFYPFTLHSAHSAWAVSRSHPALLECQTLRSLTPSANSHSKHWLAGITGIKQIELICECWIDSWQFVARNSIRWLASYHRSNKPVSCRLKCYQNGCTAGSGIYSGLAFAHSWDKKHQEDFDSLPSAIAFHQVSSLVFYLYHMARSLASLQGY